MGNKIALCESCGNWECVNRNKFPFNFCQGWFSQPFQSAAGQSEKPRKKLVYISHPYSTHGNPQANFDNVDIICQGLVAMGLPVLPVSPLHAAQFISSVRLDEQKAWHLAMEIDLALLAKCDELWVFGDYHKSKGCLVEIEVAKRKGIPTRFIAEEGL